jgi:hypothetical protein
MYLSVVAIIARYIGVIMLESMFQVRNRLRLVLAIPAPPTLTGVDAVFEDQNDPHSKSILT